MMQLNYTYCHHANNTLPSSYNSYISEKKNSWELETLLVHTSLKLQLLWGWKVLIYAILLLMLDIGEKLTLTWDWCFKKFSWDQEKKQKKQRKLHYDNINI